MNHLVLVSGGVDSTVLAYHLKDEGHRVHGLFVNYGQPAFRAEFRAAKKVFGVGSIPLTLKKVPDMETLPDGYTYPARNLLLIGYASGLALERGDEVIALGCCGDDFDRFPDCRTAFLDPLSEATDRGYDLTVVAPFRSWTKHDIWELGRVFMDIELLRETWSCYGAGPKPCGECLSCSQRMLAEKVEP